MVKQYFNPRSREGSDETALLMLLRIRPFQSTLPRRERLLSTTVSDGMYYISIHAPAKGATRFRSPPAAGVLTISIHAPAKGATPHFRKLIRVLLFQSTLPRRERRVPCVYRLPLEHFNPRSREGSDVRLRLGEEEEAISIHAPAKGATIRRQS